MNTAGSATNSDPEVTVEYLQMTRQKFRIQSLFELMDLLPEGERIMLEVLRQIVLENLPGYCREKISYNEPCFYGRRGICPIWPSSIPGGGIKKGVLLGFWNGNRLEDVDNYLDRGTNKKIFYKIY